MFECYNLIDPKEWGAAIFWGWFLKGNFKILRLLFLRSHTFIFWEIDFSNYVKNCKVWSKNQKEFLGINP
jgi:hypothetical protein